MKIIWNTSASGKPANPVKRIDLEYEIRLKVVRILIREAEHLMDYLSLVVLQIDSRNGTVTVNDETPEPLFSLIAKNLPKVYSKKQGQVLENNQVREALMAFS